MESDRIQHWNKTVSRLTISAATARSAYRTAQTQATDATARVEAIEGARGIVQSVAQSIQAQAHAAIAAVVSRCLSSVFETPYQFKILFDLKRGRTEAVMVFERDGNQVDPMTASGGGVVDLAAFALRLACLMLKRPSSRRILILDEPFKSPSPHYRERVKLLMEALSAEMGVQFIMVTNILELVTGNVIDLEHLPETAGIPKRCGETASKRIRMKDRVG